MVALKKSFVRLGSSLFPGYFTEKAYDILVNPQVRKLRDHELEVLNKSKQSDFSFQDFTIKTYVWNEGFEPVLLVHGWEGQAGNFADIIDALVSAGFTVYSFDAPSHGFSSRGETSLIEFTELVGEMIRLTEAEKVVSHSFGGVATTSALFQNRDLSLKKYGLLTTPDRFSQRLDQVEDQVGITKKVRDRLAARMEAELGMKSEELNVSDWVKEINVNEAKIWHGKSDRVIPMHQSKTVAASWSEATLKEVENVGHFAILRDKGVIAELVDFLRDGKA
jgi:pimeloyl-ACP methyl ester carboxylesterase